MLLSLLALGACVPVPARVVTGPNPALFAIVCTPGGGVGGAATTTMVMARTITVTPTPPGAELSWPGDAPDAEPVRTRLLPGEQCVIYRTL